MSKSSHVDRGMRGGGHPRQRARSGRGAEHRPVQGLGQPGLHPK